ncbi:Leucine-rich repeat [Arabidopsis suecica]|uniref:Leucine-rich repeat n=1 Tax=Arabidopsis suecica TaxID=45249 RepID=A0A8T2AFE5_ARASU|nr:Leucine-rich repeat [Arabidopsis suecica]
MEGKLFSGQYLIWMILLLGQLHGYKSCIEKERNALLELKNSMISRRVVSVFDSVLPTWNNDTKSDCCRWKGIKCNHTSGRVNGLFFEDMYYNESPLLNLSLLHPFEELRTLNLSLGYNGFFDDIEGYKSLRRLRNLEILFLSNNRFNNSIFPFLNAATSLTSLYLRYNSMDGSFPFKELKDLTNLELLDLSENRFNGSMPAELAHLKKLKTLNLSSNRFFMSLELQGLKNLTNLEVLGLAENILDQRPIPIEVVCEMKNLRELDLRGNNFVSQLPLCLGSLKKLRVLDLSSNQLSGNLPSSFSCLRSLQYLSLLDNNFTSLLSLNPLTNLTKLKVLKLSDMVQVETESNWKPKFQLSVVILRLCSLEKIPSFLVYQNNLRLVDLSSNRLSGDIPTWLLANNRELEVLELQDNSFTIFQMPTIMHNLQVLDFSANDISGPFPDNIGHALPNLVHINASDNRFHGHFPSSMGSLSLEYLKLSHNKFSGPFLPRETNFTQLSVLRMDNNLFSGKIGVGFSSPYLLTLDISNNSLTSVIPSWIFNLSYLKFLLLSNNFFEGTISSSSLNMPSLSSLDLSGNLFSGALPSHVNSSVLGKNLFLNDNNFTGPIPDTLLERVQILDLRNNKLSGSIPQFVNTQSIYILLLKGNNLTGSIPRQLCDMRNIRLLDLSYNKLNGFIPSCLYNLSFGLEGVGYTADYSTFISATFFQSEFYKSTFVVEKFEASYSTFHEIEIKFATKQRYDSYIGKYGFNDGILGYMYGMDLSSNELSGVIPVELGNLLKLRALNLSHNFLSSSIPSSFSNLKDIESLDLSYNLLQGSIPYQLTNLTSLAIFNVSYNNLSGIILQVRQFNTFNENSYLGNPLLCGPPTNRSCETKKGSEETGNGGEEDDEAAINMLVFYFSAASTYVTALIGILILMCFDCPWRRAWLRIVDAFIKSCVSLPMNSESVVAVDGADCAIANGGVTMEGDSSNENGTLENLEGCSTQHPMEASEGTQNEQVDDSKQMSRQKVQGKVKHEKTSGCKNIPSVLVKKKRDGKVVASNGSVAPNVAPVKSPKRNSLNGREAHVMKHGKNDSTPAEGTRDKPKLKATRKQVNDTSEDDTQSSKLWLHGCKSCIESERKALLELKNYMISRSVESVFGSVLPSWNNNKQSDCCRWKGIKCNHTSRRVIRLFFDDMYFNEHPLLNLSLLHPFEEVQNLNLSGLGYNGFFDDIEGYKSLRRLRNLEILDLSSNSFNNSIFPFLNTATSLTSLFLRWNVMGGAFPIKELKDLTNLELLDLRGNSFNSDMPGYKSLKRFKNLEILDLSSNRINQSIFPFLNTATSLKSLLLGWNFMYGAFPIIELKDLANLELLDLRGNSFNGSIPELIHLKKLKTLDLSLNNFLTSIVLQDLKNLTNLEALGLAENNPDGPIPIEVICEMKNLRELDLRANYVVGQLPLCLGSLKMLQVLDLSSNQLSGNLPSSFSSLESLEYLSLLDNNFTGLFSLNPLTNLTKLKVFKLSSTTDMVQVVTESNWEPKFQLSVVVLRFCNLEKIPSFLVYQNNLRLVDLSSNRLSGDIPTWLLVNNPELEVLQLRNNSFTFFQMPTIVHNLLVLDFSANNIGGLFPDNIGRQLSNLLHMNGSNNRFQGHFSSSMGEMKNLTFLDLSYNNLSGTLPRSFVTGCYSLEYLKLSHNKFSGHILSRGTSFTSIVVLRMDNNLFTGKIEVGLLSSINTLQVLDMSNNCLTGAIPSWISKLPRSASLLLSNNFLEGTIPPSLLLMWLLDLSGNLLSGALPSQVNDSDFGRYLFLNNNNFTGPIPNTLLKSFEILDLRNNKLSGSIPQFVNTQSTSILLLRGNNLTGSIPRELCDLGRIRLLDLSGNKLNGFIPSCLFNLSFGLGGEEKKEGTSYFSILLNDILTREFYKSKIVIEELVAYHFSFQEIEIKFASKQRYESYSGRSEFSNGILDFMNGMDLSNNELSGVIPEELGGLSKMQVLNLSHNFLSSSIPSSFSNLKDIESLDLSHNMLHGSIPHQLTSLTSLAVFDVSYNNLSGIIPQGRQFNTFNKESYLGNHLLCGPPTNKSCEAKKRSDEAGNGGQEDDDESAVNMLVFYFSTASTYVTVLTGILILMCFDCSWRRAWLCIVDAFIASTKGMLP